VDRYSFLVRLLPPLFHAGLARRTNISISLTDPVEGGFERKRLCASFDLTLEVAVQDYKSRAKT
jgi:hypothetical protein